MSKIILDLQRACTNINKIPDKNIFLYWLNGILPIFYNQVELTIRIVNIEESCQLNFTYRGINKATNVLAFPFQSYPVITLPLLGDLVICSQIVQQEAMKQLKSLEAHWAHIVIHGVLHLLGYNHIINEELIKMESLEKKIMKKLGYSDPYLIGN